LVAEEEDPLRLWGAVELAAEADRAAAKLAARGRQHRRKQRLRRAFGQRQFFFPELRPAVAVGEQHHLGEARVTVHSLLLDEHTTPGGEHEIYGMDSGSFIGPRQRVVCRL